MRSNTTWLTRTESAAMRGIAITAIVLHNFLHKLPMMLSENEYSFCDWKNGRLLRAITDADAMLPWRLISFFGHYGVPVFLFVSGFGLVMKYEKSGAALPVWRFVRYHYLKLFGMMIAGLTGFIVIDNVMGAQYYFQWEDILAQLLFYINLTTDPQQTITPGPYWFFGLMMQLYIIYRLLIWQRGAVPAEAPFEAGQAGTASVAGRYRRLRAYLVPAVLILACWVIMATTTDPSDLIWLRYNFFGGILAFCSGVMFGRLRPRQISTWIWAAAAVVSFAALFAAAFNYQAWLWAPLFAATGTVATVKAIPDSLLAHISWLGGLSAAMFVSHPICRRIFFSIAERHDTLDGLMLYAVTTIAVAWLFAQLMKQIPKPKL